ncbi:MAG: hypothetical protein M3094_05935, partial [Actinomycetia bacterium]|nr:hypothetical protein [Actinomycetes bacterium]
MAEDDTTSDSGGFDDWLDEKPGPPTDPYASLTEDGPEEEIADWVAFTEGRDTAGAESASEPLSDDELAQLPTEEMDLSDLPVAPEVQPPIASQDDDETSEIQPLPAEEEEDEGEVDLAKDDLTEELETIDEASETLQDEEVVTDELPSIPAPSPDDVEIPGHDNETDPTVFGLD